MRNKWWLVVLVGSLATFAVSRVSVNRGLAQEPTAPGHAEGETSHQRHAAPEKEKYPEMAACLEKQFLTKPVDGKRCLSPTETALCNRAMAYRSRLCALKAALATVGLENIADVLDAVLTLYDEWHEWDDKTTGTALQGAAAAGSLVTKSNYKCLSEAFESARLTLRSFQAITEAQDTKSIIAAVGSTTDFSVAVGHLGATIKECGVDVAKHGAHGGKANKISTAIECSVVVAGSLAYLVKDVWCLQGEVSDLIQSIERTGAKMKEMVKPVSASDEFKCNKTVAQETINYGHDSGKALDKSSRGNMFDGPVELCSPPCNMISDDFDHMGIPLSRAIKQCHQRGEHLDDKYVDHLRSVCFQHCVSESNMWWLNDGTTQRKKELPPKVVVPVENTKTYVPKTSWAKVADKNIWCKFGGQGWWKIIDAKLGVDRDKISFQFRVKSEGVGFEDDGPEYGWVASDLGQKEFEDLRETLAAKRGYSNEYLINLLHKSAEFTVENKWKASDCRVFR